MIDQGGEGAFGKPSLHGQELIDRAGEIDMVADDFDQIGRP